MRYKTKEKYILSLKKYLKNGLVSNKHFDYFRNKLRINEKP